MYTIKDTEKKTVIAGGRKDNYGKIVKIEVRDIVIEIKRLGKPGKVYVRRNSHISF